MRIDLNKPLGVGAFRTSYDCTIEGIPQQFIGKSYIANEHNTKECHLTDQYVLEKAIDYAVEWRKAVETNKEILLEKCGEDLKRLKKSGGKLSVFFPYNYALMDFMDCHPFYAELERVLGFGSNAA